jgi:hypothetical protein
LGKICCFKISSGGGCLGKTAEKLLVVCYYPDGAVGGTDFLISFGIGFFAFGTKIFELRSKF